MVERCDTQRRRLRRSWPGVIVVCCALLVSACGAAAESSDPAPVASEVTSSPAGDGATAVAPTPSTAPAASPSPVATSEPPGTAAACRERERPPLQSGSHLIGDREPPVPYSSQPPTSGWHSSGHFDVDVRTADDPLSEPDQVSVLEADGVVVAYGELPDDAVAELGDHVRDTYDQRVAVTPYTPLPEGEVVFTAWGVLKRCDGVDLAALDRFVRRFATDEPITSGH